MIYSSLLVRPYARSRRSLHRHVLHYNPSNDTPLSLRINVPQSLAAVHDQGNTITITRYMVQ